MPQNEEHAKNIPEERLRTFVLDTAQMMIIICLSTDVLQCIIASVLCFVCS